MGSKKYYDANFNDNVSLKQETILSNSKRLRSDGSAKQSFVWKFFDEKDNSSGPGKIMAYKNLLSNSKLCTITYAALVSISNAIQHLAN
ncbi:2917_t:CDS:2, partial [Funneliformis caledonium]